MSLKSEKNFMNRIGIARLAQDGTVLFDVDVPRPLDDTLKPNRIGPAMADIKAAIFLNDDEFLVAVEYRIGEAWLLRFSGDAQPVFMKPLGTLSIGAMTRTSDGNVCIAGRSVTSLLVAKYDPNGRRMWETKSAIGNVPFVRGAVSEPNGAVVVVSEVTTPDLHHNRSSEVVVTVVGRDGADGPEQRFDGGLPDIAVSPSGALGVVYATADGALHVRTYDNQLRLRSEIDSAVRNRILPEFHIVAASATDFAVVGSDHARVFVAGVRDDHLGEPRDSGLETAGAMSVLSYGDAVYIAWNQILQIEQHPRMRASLSRISLSEARP